MPRVLEEMEKIVLEAAETLKGLEGRWWKRLRRRLRPWRKFVVTRYAPLPIAARYVLKRRKKRRRPRFIMRERIIRETPPVTVVRPKLIKPYPAAAYAMRPVMMPMWRVLRVLKKRRPLTVISKRIAAIRKTLKELEGTPEVKRYKELLKSPMVKQWAMLRLAIPQWYRHHRFLIALKRKELEKRYPEVAEFVRLRRHPNVRRYLRLKRELRLLKKKQILQRRRFVRITPPPPMF